MTQPRLCARLACCQNRKNDCRSHRGSCTVPASNLKSCPLARRSAAAFCAPTRQLRLDQAFEILGEREQEIDAGAGAKASIVGHTGAAQARLIVFSRSAQSRGLPQAVCARNRASELRSGLILVASRGGKIKTVSAAYQCHLKAARLNRRYHQAALPSRMAVASCGSNWRG